MDEIRSNCLCRHLDAPIQNRLLYGAVMYNNIAVVEDVVGNIRKEGGRQADLSYPALIQSSDERIQFVPNTLE